MVGIIVGLIVALVVIVIVVNAIQQHKEKQEAEKRAKIAKFKAVIDESEELLVNLTNLPPSPKLTEILTRRCLNAAKEMAALAADSRFKQRISEFQTRLNAAEELAVNPPNDDQFMLPDNEQQLVAILQTIKKLRATLKSEQAKAAIDAQTFLVEDQRLSAIQLRITIESLTKRGDIAFSKEMVGSARQYYEKALQSINDYPHSSPYIEEKKGQLQDKLNEISVMLKSANAEDREKRAKAEEDDLDVLFQPKKKW
jgi:tetratricopeptide (TPR) repeat protein